jgi:hypothetical protein
LQISSFGTKAAKLARSAITLPLHLALGLLSMVVPRDPSLWVIGSWCGTRFADNGKWLFLQLAPNASIRPVLLTRSRTVLADLRRRNGVPGDFCTSVNETNWYGRSLEWHEERSTHRSKS